MQEIVNHNHKGMVVKAFALAIVSFFSFFVSCDNDKLETTDAIERDSVAGQYAKDVYTLISDSGIVKYRMETKEWYIFDRVDTPYWYFPQGLFFETLNDTMGTDASITSKYAKYYTDLELWDLRDSVKSKNIKGEYFETDQLFWDQKEKRVYSKEKIKITQDKRIITGRGFESNQSFTNYTIKKPEGIFPIEEQQNDEPQKEKE